MTNVAHPPAIRFNRIHRGWKEGDVRPVSHDPRGAEIDFGIAQTFVDCGVAEWVSAGKQVAQPKPPGGRR